MLWCFTQDSMKRGVCRCGGWSCPKHKNCVPLHFHTFFDNTKARKRLHLAHGQSMLVKDHSSSVHIPSHFPVFWLLVFSIIWMLHGQLGPHVPTPPPSSTQTWDKAKSHGLLRNRMCYIPPCDTQFFFQIKKRKENTTTTTRCYMRCGPYVTVKKMWGVMSTIAK
jgi:hypothetical protein